MQCLINFLNVLVSELDGQRIFGFGIESVQFERQTPEMGTKIGAKCNNFRYIQLLLILLLLCLREKSILQVTVKCDLILTVKNLKNILLMQHCYFT